MNIAIGNDHAGTEYKQEIKKMLLSENHNVNNHKQHWNSSYKGRNTIPYIDLI